jgi:hypothetical protein
MVTSMQMVGQVPGQALLWGTSLTTAAGRGLRLGMAAYADAQVFATAAMESAGRGAPVSVPLRTD